MSNPESPGGQESCSPQTTLMIQKAGMHICNTMDSNAAIAIIKGPDDPEIPGFQAVVVEELHGAQGATVLDLTMPSSPDFLKDAVLGSAVGKVHYSSREFGVDYEISGEAPMRRTEVDIKTDEVTSGRDATEAEGRAILTDLSAVLQHIGESDETE